MCSQYSYNQCIANALLKCLCLILNCRLKSFCNENDLIAPEQIGFREKSRTVDHIFTLRTAVNHHLNKKKGNKVYACFIDLRKAYDSIHHKGLFYKLAKMGINGNFLTLLKDIYKKSKCAIKVNGRRTEFFKYTKGVRQGCPLSPLLFNLYINGIVETLDQNNPTPLNMNGNLSCLLYADDLVILSTTKEGLQQSLNSASSYFDEWNLEINHEKSKCMIFNKRGDKGKDLFNIKGNALKNVKTYKYLGVIISSKKCMLSKTLDHLSVKANKALFSLKSNLNLLKMPIKLLLKVYDTIRLFHDWESETNRGTKNKMAAKNRGFLPDFYDYFIYLLYSFIIYPINNYMIIKPRVVVKYILLISGYLTYFQLV